MIIQYRIRAHTGKLSKKPYNTPFWVLANSMNRSEFLFKIRNIIGFVPVPPVLTHPAVQAAPPIGYEIEDHGLSPILS